MFRALAIVALLVAVLPVGAAQAPHENFARASTDLEALEALGRTILNTTEVALTHTVDAEDANATRRARLVTALTADLDLIADLSDIESAAYLAPLVDPYAGIAANASQVVGGFARARAGDVSGVPLLRADVLGLYGDADAFDALGFDTTRLRELIALLLLEVEALHVEELVPPFMLLFAEPGVAPLGERVAVRGIVVPAPATPAEVRLGLDSAPWRTTTTDRNGAFQLAHEVALDTRLGDHRFDAEVSTAEGLLRANATFEVTRIPTRLSFEPERENFRPDQPVTLRARLTDHRGNPLPGAQLRLAIDGGPSSDLTLLTDGTALLRYPAGHFALGAHNATLVFPRDPLHERSSAIARWNITLAAPSGGASGGGAEGGDGGKGAESGGGPGRGLDLGALPSWLSGESLVWLLVIAAVLAAEAGAWWYVREHPEFLAPETARERRVRAAIDRLARVPRGLAPDDPRRIVLLAYRDVLLALAREGAPVEHMTHREIAHQLAERGRDPAAVRRVTETFEAVRYAGQDPGRAALARYLPDVLRIVRPGGA